MIRKMTTDDKETYYKFARMFYNTGAMPQDISEEKATELTTRIFSEIMRSDVYLEGFIFAEENKPVGYAITSKSFITELAGLNLWLEELFVLKEYRSKGIGRKFLEYLKENIDDSVCRIRLEVAKDNERAKKLYKELGYKDHSYLQLIKDFE